MIALNFPPTTPHQEIAGCFRQSEPHAVSGFSSSGGCSPAAAQLQHGAERALLSTAEAVGARSRLGY